jgi:hypothetical protein
LNTFDHELDIQSAAHAGTGPARDATTDAHLHGPPPATRLALVTSTLTAAPPRGARSTRAV